MKHSALSVVAIFILSGCATIFNSKNQNITINTNNHSAKVYVDNELVGKGNVRTKQRKESHQVTVITPGFKTRYGAVIPTRLPNSFYFLFPIDMATIYGGYTDLFNLPNIKAFEKLHTIEPEYKLVYKEPDIKYITISNIKLSFEDKDKDFKYYFLKYRPKELMASIRKAEQIQDKEELKIQARENRKKKIEKIEDEKELKFEDTKFSYDVYKTLKATGFVDTVNKVFTDDNNTIVLEADIRRIQIFTLIGRGFYSSMRKEKVTLEWYIKNNYGEILDSVYSETFSGEFSFHNQSLTESDRVTKMTQDAIENSYFELHKSATFKKYLPILSSFSINFPALELNTPTNVISDKTEAALASVIVKTEKGHGSGFCISEDGYILTNYHVISSKDPLQPGKITIINSSGEEMAGTLVRANKYRDIALIKVDKHFEKSFLLKNEKSFKNLQEVFTIGAPKSIELGQSISTGLISNERKANNNDLLQLGMSVNAGNSGGPIFDSNGNLHGIIVSKLTGQNTEGVSFAIPSYMVGDFLNISYKK